MNRSLSTAVLVALPLFTMSVATAAPQYAVIDLGPADIAGAGLAWESKDLVQPAPSSWPSLGGAAAGAPAGYIHAQYANEAVGLSPVAGSGWDRAAQWSWPTGSIGPVSVTDLGLLPGSIGNQSEAIAFNTVGDIVGWSHSAYSSPSSGPPFVARHAFLYNNGRMTDLGSIAGPNYESTAKGVNDSHEIVGQTNTISNLDSGVLSRAFVYIDGTMYNLTFYLVGGPTVRLSDALWIDCQGNIAAVGVPASGNTEHNYLLVRQGPARACPK